MDYLISIVLVLQRAMRLQINPKIQEDMMMEVCILFIMTVFWIYASLYILNLSIYGTLFWIYILIIQCLLLILLLGFFIIIENLLWTCCERVVNEFCWVPGTASTTKHIYNIFTINHSNENTPILTTNIALNETHQWNKLICTTWEHNI